MKLYQTRVPECDFLLSTLTKHVFILLFLSSLLLSGIFTADICDKELSSTRLKAALHYKSVPREVYNAGNYTRDSTATGIVNCILSCCDQLTCDTVLFHNNTCYHIKCNVSWEGACDPIIKSDEKFNNTIYVEVRSVAYITQSSPKPIEEGGEKSCDLETHAGCQENEECKLNDKFDKAECQCIDGFVRDKDTGVCKAVGDKPTVISCLLDTEESCGKNERCYVPDQLPSKSGLCLCLEGFHRDGSQQCVSDKEEPSLCDSHKDNECGINERCDIPPAQPTHIGTCVCIQGYHRNHDNQCVIDPGEHVTPIVPAITTAGLPLSKMKTCTYGIPHTCPDHMICFIPESSKKRTGLCTCDTGYEMDQQAQCHLKGEDNAVVPTDAIIDTHVAAMKKPTTIVPKIQGLTVAAGDNKIVQLPENQVKLTAFVLEDKAEGETFGYEWSLIASPAGAETGKMVGKNTDTLTLTKLIAGQYTFKIKVTGQNREGSGLVNVTVLSVARKNQPPVAIIKPANQAIKVPNLAILDGSVSTDDDKIVLYHWEELSGPIQDQQFTDNTAILKLKKLAPGSYQFKLSVTDSDGAKNSTIANVTVIKEEDYPPRANAGSDTIIRLPQNTVKLCGNMSTDDKGIVSYEWIKSADDKLTADMSGVRSTCLTLSNLQEGDYAFTLKVTDTAQQTSSAEVHVFVKAEVNKPPVAVTGFRKTVNLPLEYIVLDGSKSSDDKAITNYQWMMINGPPDVTLEDSTKAIAKVTGNIATGQYHFTLTVADKEELHSTAQLFIIVEENINEAPVAKAGKDQVVTLPHSLVEIDGSRSQDDKSIKDYTWTRNSKSLAAGDVLNGSDHQAVLQLTNLVAGRYIFTLKVTDEEGLESSDSASLVVKDDPHAYDLMELLIDAEIKQFTEEDKANLQHELTLLLPKSTKGDTMVQIVDLGIDRSLGAVKVTFYALTVGKDYRSFRSGIDTLKVLKKKIKDSGSHLLNFRVLAIDTEVCQNNCSNHGHCDIKTRKCVCDAFWMQDLFVSYFFDGESNCNWSVLYVVIITFMIVVSQAAMVWGIICFCKKRRCKCKWRTNKKRHRYSLLQEVDYKDEVELLPKGKIQNSSVMISESDFSSDEETLFVNHKKTNGFVQKPLNGITKQHLKTKLKT
ncbi:dyslexia-associated protein KIAA0319-like protein isoform X2 [Mizuhopecten yessoensis]|uniref:dyslexia-associated protein KIAA0319-like protein isoform X2 n=1 Tax=Mizuhopecten yessoensis TaxID=6573 RepID=UPI000B45C33D|nr:dyslexia-associated protein KIAA0319-like protein isoform X2 [Mizuhopecten yessoensis]